MRTCLIGLWVVAGFAHAPARATSSSVVSLAPVGRALAAPGPPARQADAICCCGVFSQSWRYSWMAPAACTRGGGSCVSPDHC